MVLSKKTNWGTWEKYQESENGFWGQYGPYEQRIKFINTQNVKHKKILKPLKNYHIVPEETSVESYPIQPRWGISSNNNRYHKIKKKRKEKKTTKGKVEKNIDNALSLSLSWFFD